MFVADYCHPRLASFSKLRTVNATNLAARVLNCDYFFGDVSFLVSSARGSYEKPVEGWLDCH